jgi:hypothetical protein
VGGHETNVDHVEETIDNLRESTARYVNMKGFTGKIRYLTCHLEI